LVEVHGKPEAGRTAYVFVPFTATEAGEVTLGFGADWWFAAFLDGRPIADTLDTGNTTWPPNVSNVQVPVELSAGEHVLALRFISGQGSSRLAIGGPEQIAAVPPSKWQPVAQTAGESLGPEIMPDASFGEDLGPDGLPKGWMPGPEGKQFAPGEVSLFVQPGGMGAHLDINTLGSDPYRTARIACPIRVAVDTLYQVTCTGTFLEGNWLAVSIQADADTGNCNFLHVLGDTTVPNAANVPGKPATYSGNVFIDQPDAYLVLTARGSVHARIDTLSIRAHPDHAKRFTGFQQQKVPWKPDYWNDVEGPPYDLRTPHIQWDDRLAPSSDPLPVLSVLPRWSQCRAMQLMERLDILSKPVMFAGPNEFGNDYWVRTEQGDLDIFRVEAAARARIVDTRYGVFYLGLMSPSTVPDWMLTAIFDRVEAGAGLVLTGEWQPFYPYPDANKKGPRDKFRESTLDAFEAGRWSRALNADTRIEPPFPLPGPFAAKADVRFYRYGKGRIVFLRDIPVPDAPPTSRTEFEAIACLTGLAFNWVSDRRPDPALAGAEIAGQNTDWDWNTTREAMPLPLAIRLSGPVAEVARLRWHLLERGLFSESVRGEATAQNGATTVPLVLPPLPVGTHWIAVQLVEMGRRPAIHDWQIARITVTGDIGVTDIVFDDTRPPFHTSGAPLTGRVVLSRALTESEQLRMVLRDADGRLWQQALVAASDGATSVPFSLNTDFRGALLNDVTAEVLRGDTVIAGRTAEICIAESPEVRENRFDYQLWQMPRLGYIAEVANRVFAGHGITSSILRTASRNLAAANIRALGITGQNYPSASGKILGADDAPVRSPCLTEPTYRKHCAWRIGVELDAGERWAPRAHLLGHEQNIGGVGGRVKGDYCFSPTCLKHFRDMMKDEYPDLEALNRAWGTRFAAWDEVTPITLDGAVMDNQPARWIDHRRHMDRVWLDWSELKMDIVHQRIPGAHAVFDNFYGGDSFSGVDYWLQLNRVVAGSALPTDMLRSFVPPERRYLALMRSAAWHPEAVTENAELLRGRFGMAPWVALLEGMRGFGYWSHVFGATPDGVFVQPVTPFLRTTLAGRLPNMAVARIRTGIHRLFFDAERDDCGIALLYSRSSEHASHIWQVLQRTSPEAQHLSAEDARDAFTEALDRQHLAHTIVSGEQLAEGILVYPRFKVLLLPFAQAVHPDAAEAIRTFVRQGGSVIADLRPAVCDHHGAHGETGQLDDVFGVRQAPELSAFLPVWGRPEIKPQAGDDGGDGVTLERTLCGPRLAVEGATIGGMVGDRPVWLSHTFGKGQAILLNAALPPRGWSTAALLAKQLAELGVTPPAELVSVSRSDSGDRTANQTGIPTPVQSEGFANGEGFMGKILFDRTAPPKLIHYRNGDIDLYGVWSFRQQRGPGTEELLLKVPRQGYIYELTGDWAVNGAHGFGDFADALRSETRFTMQLEDVRIFAVLPRPPGAARLEADTALRPDGLPEIRCQVSQIPDAGAPLNLPVRFQVTAPEHHSMPEFDTVAVTENGHATAIIVLPLDAPRGTWTVTASTVPSDSNQTAHVEVR
jgi:hypothetical protein